MTWLGDYNMLGIADTEVEKLKKAVESLMLANDEKEQHIEELRKTIKKYKRMEEIITASHGKKGKIRIIHDLTGLTKSSFLCTVIKISSNKM